MQKKIIRTAIGIFLLISFTACFDDNITDFEISSDHHPVYALPVGSITLKLSDYIFDLDTSIKADSDSLIYVLFKQDLFSLNVEDLNIDIPDVSTGQVPVPVPIAPFSEDSIVINPNIESYVFYNQGDTAAYMDSLILKSASLYISVNSTDLSPARLELTFPGIIQNGNTLVEDIDLRSQNNYFNTITLTEGDKLDYTTEGGDTNTFPFNARLIAYKGGRTELSIGSLSVNMSISNIDYSRAHGFFGKYRMPSNPYNINMPVFELIPEGVTFIRQPSFNLYFDNSFGIPLSFYFNTFNFVSTKNTSSLSIDGVPNFESEAKIINYPDNTSIGLSVKDSLILNEENSNIDEAFHMGADELYISITNYLNLAGYTNQNFITENSQMDLSFSLRLPLAAKADSGFFMEDYISFSFSDIADDLSIIDSVTINLIIENGFPTEATAEAGFMDGSKNILTTFFDGDLLESGIVEDYKVVEANEYIRQITIDQEDIQQLKDTKFLYFNFLIKTTDEGKVWVDFYSYYSLKVTVGVKATLAVNLGSSSNTN